MNNLAEKKPITLDKLAIMVANGFANTPTKEDITGIKEDISGIKEDITGIKEDIKKLDDKIDALSSKLTAHLDLSDKRYLELKRRDIVIAKWIKQIGDKTGIQIDLAELEKF